MTRYPTKRLRPNTVIYDFLNFSLHEILHSRKMTRSKRLLKTGSRKIEKKRKKGRRRKERLEDA